MLTVEDFEKIRKAVLVEGLSERKTARKFRHSRKTIKKALKHSVPPGYKKRNSPAGAVVLTEPLRFVVDTLLEKNKKIHRKQRMTGTKIHQILVDDYGFGGCVQCQCALQSVPPKGASKCTTFVVILIPYFWVPLQASCEFFDSDLPGSSLVVIPDCRFCRR